MTLSSVLNKFLIWNYDPSNPINNVTWATLSQFTPINISSSTHNEIIARIIYLYNNSPAAAGILEIASASGYIRYGEAPQSYQNSAYIPPYNINGTQTDSYVYVNSALNAYSIDANGQFFKLDPLLILAHELAHYSDPAFYTDPPGANVGPPSEITLNSEAYDYAGNTVRFENQVAANLGLSDRVAYYSLISDANVIEKNVLSSQSSWTFGTHVDIVRIGLTDPQNGNDNVIDYSSWVNVKSVLAIGLTGNDTITGGLGNDYLYGNAGGDTISGGDGNDYIFGNAPNDFQSNYDDLNWLFGDGGSDVLVAGTHSDLLFGGTDNDTLIGSTAGEYMSGDEDDDILFGNGGQDTLDGGDGNDQLVLSSSGSIQEFSSGTAIFGGAGDDRVWIGALFDRISAASEEIAYNFGDSDSGDSVVWNGHLLTGGTFTVLVEQTNTEIYNGFTGWVDGFGSYYAFEQDGSLSILLPDNAKISIADFENGDFGLTFDAWHPNWELDGLPRAAMAAGAPTWDGGESYFRENIDLLDGRITSCALAGTLAPPVNMFA